MHLLYSYIITLEIESHYKGRKRAKNIIIIEKGEKHDIIKYKQMLC